MLITISIYYYHLINVIIISSQIFLVICCLKWHRSPCVRITPFLKTYHFITNQPIIIFLEPVLVMLFKGIADLEPLHFSIYLNLVSIYCSL